MAIKSQKNKKFKSFMRSLSQNQQTQLLKKYKTQDLSMLEIYEKKYKRFIGTSPGTKNLMKDKKPLRQTPKLKILSKGNKNKPKRNYR